MKNIVCLFCILFIFGCGKSKQIEVPDASCDGAVCKTKADAGVIVDENGLILYSPEDIPTTRLESNSQYLLEVESACFEASLTCR